MAGALLALAAMTEAIARGAATGMSVADLVGIAALAGLAERVGSGVAPVARTTARSIVAAMKDRGGGRRE